MQLRHLLKISFAACHLQWKEHWENKFELSTPSANHSLPSLVSPVLFFPKDKVWGLEMRPVPAEFLAWNEKKKKNKALILWLVNNK